MKISKLFHWLYAFVMFLPILAILTNVLTVVLNKDASNLIGSQDALSIFYYAVNEMHSNVLFSWANTSFLVAPFEYIGTIFGLPTGSPIYTLLSYWLDISLIWLVFDVIMYVPLLVHRWLDKGVIE